MTFIETNQEKIDVKKDGNHRSDQHDEFPKTLQTYI